MLVKEFPEKKWQVRSVSRLLNKLKETGTTDRQAGSGRLWTARTQENIRAVGDLVLDQEDASWFFFRKNRKTDLIDKID